MGTPNQFVFEVSRNKTRINMPTFSRLPCEDFNSDITCGSMDQKYIIIGELDGEVGAVFAKNGSKCFKTEEPISDAKITAVCADPDQDLFYAGDENGKLFVLSKKGEVICETKLSEERAGPVLMILYQKGDGFS